ncbi:hypothetical protein [Halarcobacter sp.]|uniref:hypothetical protein n=1 Tax=Halarcobacter sp. TaxID=2321133 RepID=UPI003B00D86B
MLNIHFSTYFSIDTENKLIDRPSSKDLKNNIKRYIEEHLVNINSDDDFREYIIKKGQSTEIITCANNLLSEEDDSIKLDYCEKIAKRLVNKEYEAQQKVKHLDVEVQKGGLIITYFTTKDAKSFFVITKVHFIDVLMETNFKKEKATPEKEHMLKTVIVPIIDNKISNQTIENKAFITDSTKSKMSLAATFWWKEFLELDAKNTDKENTDRAFNKIDAYLKDKFYKDNKLDYYSCRNSLISYMKSSPSFTFNSAIDTIVGDGSTLDYFDKFKTDTEKSDEIKKINDEIKKLNKIKDNIIFDGSFAIDKKTIKSRMKKIIKLDNAISLSIDDEVENLRNKIVSDIDAKGKHIKIYSEDGYNEFNR